MNTEEKATKIKEFNLHDGPKKENMYQKYIENGIEEYKVPSLKRNINLILDGQNKTISLNQRKIWTDEKIDFTCIEIKEKEDNIYSFFNLDDNIFTNENYLNQKVFMYAINSIKNGRKLVFSNGIIKGSQDNNFEYTCNTYPGFSGGCIVNKDNNCVIGIHQGEIKTSNENIVNAGIFIRDVINYIKEHKNISLSNVN